MDQEWQDSDEISVNTRWIRWACRGLFLLVTGCLFLLLSQTSEASELKLKTSSQTILELEGLLSQTPLQNRLQPLAPAQMEELFTARSAAHRLRLSQIFMEIATDPGFKSQFPQYASFAERPHKAVQALLAHDQAKMDPRTSQAIRVLSRLQGYDQYTVPEGVSEETHSRIKKILKDAIDDINVVDHDVMKTTYQKMRSKIGGVTDTWVSLHKEMSDVLDFYDTWKSRQSEMAGSGTRTLQSPSQWLETLEKSKKPELKTNGAELARKIELAKFVEAKDPLKNKAAFATAEDILQARRSLSGRAISQVFDAKSQSLKIQSQGLNAKAKAVQGLRSAGRGGVASAAVLAAQYLLDPNSVSGEDVLPSLMLAMDTSNCDSNGCHNFVEQCGRSLGLEPPFNLTQISKQSSFVSCLESFFKQTIEYQTRVRNEDANLNRFLTQFRPLISDIQCDNSQRSVTVLSKSAKMSSRQTLNFSQDWKLQQVRKENDETTDFIVFGRNSIFQRCSKTQSCENHSLDFALDQPPYPWLKKNLPVEGFHWAQENMSLFREQLDEIKSCCLRETCQKTFKQLRQQQRSVLSAHPQSQTAPQEALSAQ